VEGTESGRWITMDVKDINGDGLSEILLGAAYTPNFGAQGEGKQRIPLGPSLLFMTPQKSKL
ncbi:MAG TPA: hypothetical protein PLY93_10540, partial [Turneriella sp.]|nr:hypothetical protein [Turneriella sp.]